MEAKISARAPGSRALTYLTTALFALVGGALFLAPNWAARAWGDFEQTNPLTWVFVGSLVLSLLAIGALCYGMEAHRSARARRSWRPRGRDPAAPGTTHSAGRLSGTRPRH